MLKGKDEDYIVRDLMIENKRLLHENNELLKKILRRSNWGFFFKIVWLLILLGVPFAFYYYGIKPYFVSVGESFQSFSEGLHNVPGWTQFYDATTNFNNRKE